MPGSLIQFVLLKDGCDIHPAVLENLSPGSGDLRPAELRLHFLEEDALIPSRSLRYVCLGDQQVIPLLVFRIFLCYLIVHHIK